MSTTEDFNGELHRRKGKFGAWKPYFYTIKGTFLLEWKIGSNRLVDEPRHLYPLKGCFVEDAGALSGKSLAFQYHAADGQSHIFLAPTKKEKETWMRLMLTAQIRMQDQVQAKLTPNVASQNKHSIAPTSNVDGFISNELGADGLDSPRSSFNSTRSQPRPQFNNDKPWLARETSESSMSFELPDSNSDANSVKTSGSRQSSSGSLPILNFLDSFTDAVVVADSAGIIISVNNNAEQMFGWTKAELVNKNVNVLMPEPFKSQHDTYLYNHQVYGTENMVGKTSSFKGQRSDGSIFNVQISLGKLPHKGYFLASLRNLDDFRASTVTSRLSSIQSTNDDITNNPPAIFVDDEIPSDASTQAFAWRSSFHAINPLVFGGSFDDRNLVEIPSKLMWDSVSDNLQDHLNTSDSKTNVPQLLIPSTKTLPQFSSRSEIPPIVQTVEVSAKADCPPGAGGIGELIVKEEQDPPAQVVIPSEDLIIMSNAPPGAGGDNLIVADVDAIPIVFESSCKPSIDETPVSVIDQNQDTQSVVAENEKEKEKVKVRKVKIKKTTSARKSSLAETTAPDDSLETQPKPKRIVKKKKTKVVEVPVSSEANTSAIEPAVVDVPTALTRTKIVRQTSKAALMDLTNSGNTPNSTDNDNNAIITTLENIAISASPPENQGEIVE